jgi:hypothetical protein
VSLRTFAPGAEVSNLPQVMRHLNPPGADGGSGWPAAVFVVRPAGLEVTEVADRSCAGDRSHGPDRVVLGVAHPGQRVTPGVHHGLADRPEKPELISRAHQGLVTLTEGTQRSGQVDPLADVAHVEDHASHGRVIQPVSRVRLDVPRLPAAGQNTELSSWRLTQCGERPREVLQHLRVIGVHNLQQVFPEQFGRLVTQELPPRWARIDQAHL